MLGSAWAQGRLRLPVESQRVEPAADDQGRPLAGIHRLALAKEKLTAEVNYADGFEDGLMTVRDQQGRVKFEIPFERGQVNGVVKNYGLKGQVVWAATYRKGLQ